MVYLGQSERYVGESCWTWGGGDTCVIIPVTYVLSPCRTYSVQKEGRYVSVQSEGRISFVQKEGRYVNVQSEWRISSISKENRITLVKECK